MSIPCPAGGKATEALPGEARRKRKIGNRLSSGRAWGTPNRKQAPRSCDERGERAWAQAARGKIKTGRSERYLGTCRRGRRHKGFYGIRISGGQNIADGCYAAYSASLFTSEMTRRDLVQRAMTPSSLSRRRILPSQLRRTHNREAISSCVTPNGISRALS